MTLIALPYIQKFRDRHGRWRYYFRRAHVRVALPGQPGDPAFMAAYQRAAAAFESRGVKARSTPPAGSFNALIAAYYRSPAFVSLSVGSKKNYERLLNRWKQEHGLKPVTHLERRHIVEHMALRHESAGPEAANGLRKVLKITCGFAVAHGWRNDDPTIGLKKYKSTGSGYEPWSETDIARFLEHWPTGTRERLALCLLLYLGQRRGDTVRMGRQHRDADTIRVTQEKTGTQLTIPLHPELIVVLNELPNENLTFITTAYGKPFTAAGFGNWFREACDRAGLKNRSAHGLRKAAARRLAEAGCSTKEIAAITGHKTLAEIERYTASADQERMAREAIRRLIKDGH